MDNKTKDTDEPQCCMGATVSRPPLIGQFEARRKWLITSLNEVENIIQKLQKNPQMEQHYKEISDALYGY